MLENMRFGGNRLHFCSNLCIWVRYPVVGILGIRHLVRRSGDVSPMKLEERIRMEVRLRYYSIRTEEAYVHWYRQFVRFHQLQHPETMGVAEVEAFLSHLAVNRNVSASTQNRLLTRIPKLIAAILRNFLGINGFVEVRRIVKIRLASPQPFLLQALAQSHPLQHRSSG
jgi:hypothetical protein